MGIFSKVRLQKSSIILINGLSSFHCKIFLDLSLSPAYLLQLFKENTHYKIHNKQWIVNFHGTSLIYRDFYGVIPV